MERHLLLGMLRLFNPLQILKMENQVVEGIAAEDKLTRDRRMALKQQKKAIEEAKSLCASLAMRSELRGFDGALEDDVDSDDEEDMHRYADAPAFQQGRGQQQQQQQQQPRQEQSRQEQSRQEQQIPLQREPQRYSQGQSQQQIEQQRQQQLMQQRQQQILMQQQQQQAKSQGRPGSRADNQRDSAEWNYYTTSGDHSSAPQVPSSAPPPPPRPPKPEEDGDADTPRSSYPQSPNRPDSKRESTRHRYNILGR